MRMLPDTELQSVLLRDVTEPNENRQTVEEDLRRRRMDLILSISLHQYDNFLERVEAWSWAYKILAGGNYERERRRGYFERFVKVRCTKQDAITLLAVAQKRYSELAPQIATKEIDSAGD